jgi:hypothetical protein
MAFPCLDFFQMIHCMAAYFNPETMKKAFPCLTENSIEMIPSNDPLSPILKKALSEYPYREPRSALDALDWTYKINSFVHTQLYHARFDTYLEFIKRYDTEKMVISFWSHPTWKMIHYYASRFDGSERYALMYKAFVSCLQFCLPCPKCRQHLRDNLAEFPIDGYSSSASRLFLWSYLLHQRVNSQLGKRGISLEEASRRVGLLE